MATAIWRSEGGYPAQEGRFGAEGMMRRRGRVGEDLLFGARWCRRGQDVMADVVREMVVAIQRLEGGYPARGGHEKGKAMPLDNTPEQKRKEIGVRQQKMMYRSLSVHHQLY